MEQSYIFTPLAFQKKVVSSFFDGRYKFKTTPIIKINLFFFKAIQSYVKGY
jgi:hypothetical protein